MVIAFVTCIVILNVIWAAVILTIMKEDKK